MLGTINNIQQINIMILDFMILFFSMFYSNNPKLLLAPPTKVEQVHYYAFTLHTIFLNLAGATP
jgi:hypothetical protein